MEHLNIAKDFLAQVKSGESTVEQFMKKADIGSMKNEAAAAELFMTAIEAKAIESEGIFGNKYLESFNRTRQQELGITDEVSLLTDEEQSLIKDKSEKFAMTMSDGTGTLQNGIIATNISAQMEKYFYDSNILSAVDLLPAGTASEEITDVTNDRAGENRAELTAPTPVDDTTVVDTLTPAKNGEISDSIVLSDLLWEVQDPRTAALRIARMERALRNRVDANIIGATGSSTNGANQFYSILNNLASTGTNRGSLAQAVTAVGVTNHIDAINYVLGQINFFNPEDVAGCLVVGNWATVSRVIRTLDANNRYYFDPQTRVCRDLMTGSAIQVNNNMPANTIGVFDMKNYKVKLAFSPKLKMVEATNGKTLKYFTAGDGTPTFAYKATATKNGFRHFVIETDNNYAS
jgi:hypothetical protein